MCARSKPYFSQKAMAPGKKGCVCRYMHCTPKPTARSRRQLNRDAARPRLRNWGKTNRRTTCTISTAGEASPSRVQVQVARGLSDGTKEEADEFAVELVALEHDEPVVPLA